MCVKGNSHDADIANNKLEGIRVKVHQIISQLTVLGKPFNIHTIKNTLDGRSLGQAAWIGIAYYFRKVVDETVPGAHIGYPTENGFMPRGGIAIGLLF